MFSLILNIKIIATLFIAFLLVNAVRADIYIYIDEKGNQHFAERKVDKNYRLLLRSDTNKAPATFKNWKEKSYNNTHVPRDKRLQHLYHPLIVKATNNNQLEPAFLHAVITAESSYKKEAVSSAGAMGLMQLMPVTAERFGVDDPFDPRQSINAGALYLNILLEEFKTKELALAAYNAGEGTIRRNNLKIPPYPETRRYVDKVIGFYWYYKDNL
ncbi:lytic transglycosylase domain-containing protein [Psychromonas sp. KJ10-10]|uniref:lytic transglycosylase domain-containing protein n=1 Tax=Psychromonas sp. KJ10-10 TaxID=3391823 RepID=UPI0039B5F960